MTTLIGSRITRLEDEPLLRGKGRFVDDIAVPGVHAVFTLDDLSAVMVNRRMVRHSNSGMPLDKCWAFALAPGETSYVGEPVAMVMADDRYIAEDAAALVMVDYDPLPFAADVRTAKSA